MEQPSVVQRTAELTVSAHVSCICAWSKGLLLGTTTGEALIAVGPNTDSGLWQVCTPECATNA